jgi:hypothetical protein
MQLKMRLNKACDCIIEKTEDFNLSCSVEKSPSNKECIYASSQKIPHVLWKLTVRYRVNISPSVVSQINPVLLLYTFMICFNVIFPSTTRFPKWPFFRFPNHTVMRIFSILMPSTRPKRIFVDEIMQIISNESRSQ